MEYYYNLKHVTTIEWDYFVNKKNFLKFWSDLFMFLLK